MEILKEIVPKLSRIAVLGTSNNPGNAQALKEIELAADALNVQLQILDVLLPKKHRGCISHRNQGGVPTASSHWRVPF